MLSHAAATPLYVQHLHACFCQEEGFVKAPHIFHVEGFDAVAQ